MSEEIIMTLPLYFRTILLSLVGFASVAVAQVNVTTFHNDNARTGQNLAETALTPANVNPTQFGKLFSVAVDGYVYAQPLYLSNVVINGGTHNVVYVATEHDSLYAIDADTGTVYWQVNMIPAGGSTVNGGSDAACDDIVPEIGTTGTPVIDIASKTIYLVTKTKEAASFVQRLHAIDVVTHAEKFGGPKVISASVPGTGEGNSGGKINFDPLRENQRPALLLQNGHVVISWAAHCDVGPYQGWVISYNASTLAQEAAYATTPNGGFGGIWMSGSGIASDSSSNLYFSTGNGSWDGNSNFGNSIVKLGPPSSGAFAKSDYFTPFNQSSLSGGDTDVGSGGVLLLPTLSSGSHPNLLVEGSKEGKIYVVDRNNLGHFCSTCASSDTQIVQEIPGAVTGVFSTPAYWNGLVYFGGKGDTLKAFSFNANNSGLLSTSPVAKSPETYAFPGTTPSISANGNTNGIVWTLLTAGSASNTPAILRAHNASDVTQSLYNSAQAANNRDRLAGAAKFAVPTVANGKVYVGTNGQVSAFGLLSTAPTTPPTTPTTVATPTFSPASGTYTSPQTVTLSVGTAGATVHCTIDGSAPTAASPVCSSLTLSSTTTINAIASKTGSNNSAVASGVYTIAAGNTPLNFGSGFTSSGLKLNGKATINGTRLRLTDGGTSQAGSGFFTSPVNVQSFTTDFRFQITAPNADGFTFVIQNNAATALGPSGGALGYGVDKAGATPFAGMNKSVALKFDLYSNSGEGSNSTGLYTGGASPTTPAADMTASGVNLHSGGLFDVHLSYDGATLSMKITDAGNPATTFSTSWTVNIPSAVGGNTALVGFSGGTGSTTATQDIVSWTYNNVGAPPAVPPPAVPPPATPVVYQTEGLKAVSSGPAFRPFAFAGFPDGVGTVLDSTKVGDSVTFTVNIAQAGIYDLQIGVKKGPWRSIWQLAVNGTNVGPQEDEYNANDVYQVLDLGNVNVKAPGTFSFKFTVTGKNPAATDWKMSFDTIKLTPQ
jgi:hypothetical protein